MRYNFFIVLTFLFFFLSQQIVLNINNLQSSVVTKLNKLSHYRENYLVSLSFRTSLNNILTNLVNYVFNGSLRTDIK